MKKDFRDALKNTGMGYILNFIKKGYKYIISFDGKEVYATSGRLKADNTFADSTKFDVFKLNENEKYLFNKNTLIDLRG